MAGRLLETDHGWVARGEVKKRPRNESQPDVRARVRRGDGPRQQERKARMKIAKGLEMW